MQLCTANTNTKTTQKYGWHLAAARDSSDAMVLVAGARQKKQACDRDGGEEEVDGETGCEVHATVWLLEASKGEKEQDCCTK
jgi:hypothetical protein